MKRHIGYQETLACQKLHITNIFAFVKDLIKTMKAKHAKILQNQ